MAMINCPECGKSISDKAKVCPNCGCPIAGCTPSGTVRIKVSAVHASDGFNGRQKASIIAGDKVLWKGNTDEVAELFFDGPTSVVVKYHMSMMHYGGECRGVVDPSKSRSYNVTARQGVMCVKLSFQTVDFLS